MQTSSYFKKFISNRQGVDAISNCTKQVFTVKASASNPFNLEADLESSLYVKDNEYFCKDVSNY